MIEPVRRRRPRTVRREINAARAADAVGELRPGGDVAGLSKGHFSMVELVEHCLNQIGPAHLTIATWTAGGADIRHCWRLVKNGKILSARWLVDRSFVNRQPGYCRALVRRFGSGAVIATSNHAKFTLLGNEEWRLVVRSSMNLNFNRRLEWWEVSDDPDLFSWFEDVIESAFVHGCSLEEAAADSTKAFRSIDRIGGSVGTKQLAYGSLATHHRASYSGEVRKPDAL